MPPLKAANADNGFVFGACVIGAAHRRTASRCGFFRFAKPITKMRRAFFRHIDKLAYLMSCLSME